MTAQTPAFMPACTTLIMCTEGKKKSTTHCKMYSATIRTVQGPCFSWQMKLSCRMSIKPGLNLEQHNVAFVCHVHHLLYAVVLQYMHLFYFFTPGVIRF